MWSCNSVSYVYEKACNLQDSTCQFVGNCFNIIFYDAAGVHYLREHMIKFIENFHGKEANRLLQAVLSDLKSPILFAGCRALGLVNKVVTGPLWRNHRLLSCK